MPAMSATPPVFFDAGLFIAALLRGDSRHVEARGLVEKARNGALNVCTTAGVLTEVYAALTWEKATPAHTPEEAGTAVKSLIETSSAIQVLSEDRETGALALDMAARHGLKARRVHDARHAATALRHGVRQVYSYDVADWRLFETDGLMLAGPESVVRIPVKAGDTKP